MASGFEEIALKFWLSKFGLSLFYLYKLLRVTNNQCISVDVIHFKRSTNRSVNTGLHFVRSSCNFIQKWPLQKCSMTSQQEISRMSIQLQKFVRPPY